MTATPTLPAPRVPLESAPEGTARRRSAPPPSDRVRTACELLRRHGVDPDPRVSAGGTDALATALMDLFRRTGSSEVFEVLCLLSEDQLLRRVRARTRFLGERLDADELLQDALINIYRYPDRFDASRPGAFRAWSSTIVDNAVRRHMRRSQSGVVVRLRPVEVLAQEPDRRCLEPGQHAMESEAVESATRVFRLFLVVYLHAFRTLSERERFVLQMVEVKGMRYAPLAEVLGIRPEALKMVVFRARRRIFERMASMLPRIEEERPAAGRSREMVALAG